MHKKTEWKWVQFEDNLQFCRKLLRQIKDHTHVPNPESTLLNFEQLETTMKGTERKTDNTKNNFTVANIAGANEAVLVKIQ